MSYPLLQRYLLICDPKGHGIVTGVPFAIQGSYRRTTVGASIRREVVAKVCQQITTHYALLKPQIKQILSEHVLQWIEHVTTP